MRPSCLRLFLCLCVVLSWGSALAGPAPAAPADTPTPQSTAASRILTVGVKVAPPFVIADADGYHGMAIDLWQQAAEDHGWKYRYQRYDLAGLLEAVRQGKVDVGVGAITATARRAQDMDFTHPMASSGLGVAVRSEQTSGWMAVARALVSWAFLKVIITLAILLLIVGFLVWLFEHKRNPDQFGGSRTHGIFSGFWWAMVTMTTVGYGDTAPSSVGGRILGMLWMLTALVIVSFFTASITSALTVGQLSQRVQGANDLAHMRVASVASSTSGVWLSGHHLDYSRAKTLEAALADLAAGRIDAVVYDKPLLRWDIHRQYRGKLNVLPLVLERQDYAFALPLHSPLRKGINTSLLKQINSPDWPERLHEYMNGTP